MIAALKFIHIAGLTLWCAALMALPVLLHTLGRARGQVGYDRFRLVTHLSYIALATPAALVTIAAGSGLIFAAGVFTPWLALKLALVSGMVLMHVWFGHLVQISGERRRSRFALPFMGGLVVVIGLILAVLAVVLTKPDLGFVRDWIPDQLLVPRAGSSDAPSVGVAP